jgi:hypothetical protein
MRFGLSVVFAPSTWGPHPRSHPASGSGIIHGFPVPAFPRVVREGLSSGAVGEGAAIALLKREFSGADFWPLNLDNEYCGMRLSSFCVQESGGMISGSFI